MKRYILISCIALSQILLFSTNGYSQDLVHKNDKNLIGIWKLDKTLVIENLNNEGQKKVNEMPDHIKKVFFESLESRVYHFENDKTFSAFWQIKDKKENISGTWELLEGDRLNIIFPNETKRYLVEFNEGYLSLTPEVANGGLIQNLFFTKSN